MMTRQLLAMSEDRIAIGYEAVPPAARLSAGRVSLILVGVQALWFFPAALGLWVLLCDHGLIDSPAANFAGAAVVVTPSLAAIALAAPVLVRSRREKTGTAGLAVGTIIAALCFIVYVLAAAVHDLRQPGPRCL
jgi:hypothetical protein